LFDHTIGSGPSLAARIAPVEDSRRHAQMRKPLNRGPSAKF
jgi:hypothetical protein